ncbi:MAG: hypothetical protein ABJE95_16885 [Byssovorax sp.]
MANARPTIPALTALLLASLAFGASGSLAGCGGGSSTSTGGGGGSSCGLGADGCFDYTCFTADMPAVGFKADVLPIFRTSCGLSASCHGSQNGPGGQHFLGPKKDDPAPSAADIQVIFDQWVGQTPVVNAGMNLITAKDPEHSFLMYKLDGLKCSKLSCASDDTCLALMPQGNTEPMPAAQRDVIRRWIAQGAKND